jgi:penicillin-binding protein 2
MLHKPLVPNRNKIYYLIIALLFTGTIIFNLFSLQVAQGSKYFFDSQNSDNKLSVSRATRGLIYDRNGTKLVENVVKYNLYMYIDNPESKRFKTTIENLSKVFGEDVLSKYTSEYERVKNYKNINEVKLYTKIDYNPFIFQIEANPQNFPLILAEKTNIRRYLYPELISHIVGYTGEITEEDYKTGRYKFGDEIGKSGIEKGYDDILRGVNGMDRIDFYGSDGKRTVSSLQQKINGQDIYLTIDINYQAKLYESIQNALELPFLKRSVSVSSVVEDVKTGEILAMASYPNFDANKFASGISQADYETYLNTPGKPLVNKAIQYSQPPGSIFKPITAMVALQEGAINRSTSYATGGTYDYGGVTFRDAGNITRQNRNVVDSICESSNIFHMKAALATNEKTSGKAADIIKEKFSTMDMDKISDLNIGYEAPGYFPIPKDKEAKGEQWLPGYLMNASIGQGDVRMTTLNAVKIAAVVANGGEYVKQSIVKSDNNSTKPSTKNIGINPEHVATVSEGMKCSGTKDNYYLGRGVYDKSTYPAVSDKTGTAETGQKLNGQDVIHGWEITFTPSDKPEIAMAIFMENGSAGFRAGYMSREFYKVWDSQLRKK